MARLNYRTVTVVVLVATVTLVGVFWAQSRSGSTANGTGLTYQNSFYWASGAQVRSDALGREVARAVPFQDTATTLREINGLDPAITLAAWLPMISTQVPYPAWILISTDQGRGTDPRSFPDTAAVLVPR